MQIPGQSNGLFARTGLPHHAHIWLVVDQLRRGLTQHHVVIGQKDTNLALHVSFSLSLPSRHLFQVYHSTEQVSTRSLTIPITQTSMCANGHPGVWLAEPCSTDNSEARLLCEMLHARRLNGAWLACICSLGQSQ
jgi:hypothetical protein